MDNETMTAEVEQETTEQPQPFAGLEAETSDEPVESVGGEISETADAETAEPEDYQLPSEESKVFKDEEYQKFADKRYPELAKLLNDNNLPEPTRAQVKQIIHDKLNGDIRIKQLMEAGEEVEEEPLEEEQELEPTQNLPPEEAEKAWDAALTSFSEKVTDSKTAQKFMTDLRAVAEIKDPVQRDIAEVKVLTKGVANVVPAILDDYLFTPGKDGASLMDKYLEARFPGFAEGYQDNARSSEWKQIQDAPEFAALKLPNYGTPEWMQSVNKVASLLPGFEKARFSNDPIQNFAAKARIHAQLLAGTATQSTVATAVKAVEKGKQLERQAQQRKNLGNLGAGQTKGKIAQNANLSQSDEARKASIARLREDSDPFATLRKES
jgi:hypothetical protein